MHDGGISMAAVEIDFLHRQLEERKRRLEAVFALSPDDAGVETLLREVDSALDRFAAGTYGECEICHGTVERDRLLADPLIRYCLDHLTEHERASLQRDLDPSAGIIDLYPQEITRVFLNLISNGFYAANKRKEAGDDGFEPTLGATTKSLGNKVEIRIRDNGTGIPLEVKEKMFNPFFTTKPAGEGTGLGLSMSHDIIVKQHGGKIEVDTMPGAFTEFIITLPRTAAAQPKAGGAN